MIKTDEVSELVWRDPRQSRVCLAVRAGDGLSTTAGLLVCCGRQHGHKPEHTIIDEMALDATDHEIGPGPGKIYHFPTVSWLQAWIQSHIDSIRRIVDRGDSRRHARGRRGLLDIDVARLRSRIIDDWLVKPTNEKVDRPICRDLDVVWD
jgi:hypothetical protein